MLFKKRSGPKIEPWNTLSLQVGKERRAQPKKAYEKSNLLHRRKSMTIGSQVKIVF